MKKVYVVPVAAVLLIAGFVLATYAFRAQQSEEAGNRTAPLRPTQ